MGVLEGVEFGMGIHEVGVAEHGPPVQKPLLGLRDPSLEVVMGGDFYRRRHEAIVGADHRQRAGVFRGVALSQVPVVSRRLLGEANEA